MRRHLLHAWLLASTLSLISYGFAAHRIWVPLHEVEDTFRGIIIAVAHLAPFLMLRAWKGYWNGERQG